MTPPAASMRQPQPGQHDRDEAVLVHADSVHGRNSEGGKLMQINPAETATLP